MKAGLNSTVVNDGQVGYLEVFSMYLAALVLFRFVFASIYILVWKFRFNFDARYKIRRVNLTKEFKEIKKRAEREYRDDSTDDEEMEEKV